MTVNNTTLSNSLYVGSNGTAYSSPFVVQFESRDPGIYDIQYPIQKMWLNTATDNFWFLRNFTTASGSTYANWIPITSIVVTESLTTDDGAEVPPNPITGEINLFGDHTYIRTAGDPATNTVTIEGIPGSIVSKFTVDAHTNPGTNPVLPDSTGNVTVTGGQVAAGTTTNVIRTDSLAANTYTIEVQRSQAVATSTIGDNGVSHFNSADFTVDSNGFVSAIGGTDNFAFNYTNVTHAMSPYTVNVTTPPVDSFISVDCSGGAVQLNFPDAPTFKQLWVIKDRTGNAAVNNITLTTPGGTVTFDGLTTFTMNSNYQAINLLANATPTYEVY